MAESYITGTEVAIIGMAGRFPGAETIEQFWQNLAEGVESIQTFSDEELLAAGIELDVLRDPAYVKARGYLPHIDLFDAAFFGYSPREAALLDPQHRLLLEGAWETLENAGYDPERYAGSIGVYVSASPNTYFLENVLASRSLRARGDTFQLLLASSHDFLATRISYKLNLRGPSINVQTACSSSLVAVHLAWQSLLNHECDMALAGGISLSVPEVSGYFFQPGGINSPDGHCRAFSAEAQGTVRGSGMGLVLLKRLPEALEDGDHIYAVVKASAINNDGSLKVGFTAPSVLGQTQVIAEAMALANCDPETITYIEAHGTGTVLGDSIELRALKEAFATKERRYCAIGSLKTNIGHLDAAAGIAGLIKTVLALQHQQIPPSLHFTSPNPAIDFEDSPFFVNTALRPWLARGERRRAGVSSFGIGGTNAHVVLEEAPPVPVPVGGAACSWQLLVLSARSLTALDAASLRLATYLSTSPTATLADIAYTLQLGRRQFPVRRALVCRSSADGAEVLRRLDTTWCHTSVASTSAPQVVFLLPGQGTQYVNMGRELYETEEVFRACIDTCASVLKKHLDLDLRTVLYPPSAQAETMNHMLTETWLTQPAIFVVSYALAQLWLSRGVRPWALLGHSIGEYVAACLAEVFTLEDALGLVAVRGRLIQRLPRGSMLSVPLAEHQLLPYLSADLSLAALNGAEQSVIAGPEHAIEELAELLRLTSGVVGRRLQTSHAFHSSMMEPARNALVQFIRTIPRRSPAIPFLANVTGNWITDEQATSPDYWGEQLCRPVRFADCLEKVCRDESSILLEVGPGHALTTIARWEKALPETRTLASLPRRRASLSEAGHSLLVLGKLWTQGIPIHWPALHPGTRQRVALPTYPFERQRYWLDSPASFWGSASAASEDEVSSFAGGHMDTLAVDQPETLTVRGQLHPRPKLSVPYIAPASETERAIACVWQEVLGIAEIGVRDHFTDLGGDSLLATQVLSRLRSRVRGDISLAELLSCPTVAELAVLLDRTELVEGDTRPANSTEGGLEDILKDLNELTETELASLVQQLETDDFAE